MDAVNYIGIAFWLIVLIFIFFTFHNIRVRRLKRIVAGEKGFYWPGFLLSGLLIVIAFAGLWLASYATFFRNVDLTDKQEISLSYKYKPLVMSSINGRFYDVKVENGNGKQPTQYYTYWVDGARYQISSNNATIVSGAHPMNVSAGNYPWKHDELAKQEKKTERTFVATMTATYKSNFMNGLGIRAGRKATTFSMIRVPNSSVIYIKKDNSK
ncbi:LVIS_2131 family protein [Loigolactobacillus backii]|uniref:Uncharacterized protein n=1 Tax=Loigolactobacillus backii TaxID=375175 RepID=A0A192H1H7_9LACO|nr:LVIS_2131 family protein [Loigolactobacillus backii]ANK60633.1 hypothetical protein AYR52_10445 [Loigolactobacillus backii]ANK61801.1 hypothetical protein AYR53_02880 [Loigolactobacillus backii]ANK65586.1 hypothetical protein AYR54_10250 [Loigolactobacillus backii]ANK68057.1 hypothetical protein AYR55_10370 [Loigolactobacillus backii]ANK69005.1 hypothetical protein AYR56_01845 [Loigolactobacillus backii]